MGYNPALSPIMTCRVDDAVYIAITDYLYKCLKTQPVCIDSKGSAM